VTPEFTLLQNGQVTQIAIKLKLRNKGDMPFDKLPNQVEIIDELEVAAVPDSQGTIVMFKAEIDLNVDWPVAVVIPIRLAVLESVVAACGSTHPPRMFLPTESMTRQQLESALEAQLKEINQLRSIIASKGDWNFTDKGTT
jgi:hypothetical protein